MHVQVEEQKTDALPLMISPLPKAGTWPRVLLAGKVTGMAAPGWKEAHMLGLARALPAAGVAARLWRPWEDSLSEADCLHVFGSLQEHLPVVEVARRQHLPVALSTMAWHGGADGPGQLPSLSRHLAVCVGLLGRTVCPRWRSWRQRLYQSVDLLLPHSHAEAQQLMHYYHVPAPRLHIVPGAADPQLAAADPEPFAQLVGARNFALYWGPIEPRTNQLGFLWAMRNTDLPVVMLGDVAPGCDWYLDECRRAAGPRVQFVANLGRNDPLLASAYAACGCLVVGSWRESGCSVALGAAMSGTPLVLPEGGCAGEYFGRAAFYVNPRDLSAIRRAVLAALARGRSPSLARHVQTYFSWSAVAKATRVAYDSLLGRK